MTMGEYLDQCTLYPNAIVTSAVRSYMKSYDEIGKMFTDHKFGDKVLTIDLASDAWTLAAPFKHVDPAVQTETMAVVSGIAAKSVDVEK